MKKIYLFYLWVLLAVNTSCTKWIDLKPTDRLSEAVLYSTQEGFLKALNGIYIEMSNPDLYGRFLTAGELDVMGQYYMKTVSRHRYIDYMEFSYLQALPKSGFQTVWEKAYSTIANINVILEHCEKESGTVLKAPYNGIVKGEALALRAMLHFDLLRVFGPAWSPESKDVAILPYYTAVSNEISPLYTSEEVLSKLINDLEEARSLLLAHDPIVTSGRKSVLSTSNNSLGLRQYRLNYYAVNALMARIHLWKGDREQAGRAAREVIAAVQQLENPIFPFVTTAAATNNASPDRLFTSEVMFSMYTVNRVNMHNNLFSAAQNISSRLAPNEGNTDKTRIDALYDDKNDYRYKVWTPSTLVEIELLTNQKYKDDLNGPGRYMIPLIRLTELYLIAAECSDQVSEAAQYINTIRLHRNAFNLNISDSQTLQTAITNEYRREMLGEGQQFFYYKRKGFTQIPDHAKATGNKLVSLNIYQIPLPESEISLRNDK